MNIQKLKTRNLYETLKTQIMTQELPESSKLPSESELISKYGVSRYGARKAIDKLVSENLVVKHQGKGCFVLPLQNPIKPFNNSKQILLIASRAEHFYFLKSINGIERALQESGYTLTIKLSNYNSDIEASLFKAALKENYAGFLIFPSGSAYIYTNLYLYRYIESHKIPCIILGNRIPCVNLPSVVTDDYMGGHLAADYFIAKGHTSFACIINKEEYSGCMRYAGFIEGINMASPTPDPPLIFWFGHEEKDHMFIEREKELLLLASRVTAIFCFNDETAVNLYQLLVKNGFRVPEDISIIGYDDSYLCETNPLPLTSLHQDPEISGYTAAKNLLHLIAEPSYNCNKTFIPYLVERNSVAEIK